MVSLTKELAPFKGLYSVKKSPLALHETWDTIFNTKVTCTLTVYKATKFPHCRVKALHCSLCACNTRSSLVKNIEKDDSSQHITFIHITVDGACSFRTA